MVGGDCVVVHGVVVHGVVVHSVVMHGVVVHGVVMHGVVVLGVVVHGGLRDGGEDEYFKKACGRINNTDIPADLRLPVCNINKN